VIDKGNKPTHSQNNTTRTSAFDFGKVSSWHCHGWLIIDTTFETGRAPVYELNGTFGLDCCDCCIDILGDYISTVHEATGHVFTMTRITLGHHIVRFKDTGRNFGNRHAFVVSLVDGKDWGVGRQHKVDARVGDQVCLEFRNINVQSPIKTKRGGQGRNDLSNQSIQVGVRWTFNVEVAATHVVQGFVLWWY